MADEYSDEVAERIIADEMKVWKKNAPLLYDVVITHALDWPSLTCQWLPTRNEVAGGDYTEQKLILGTHTSAGEDNYLMIADVLLPSESAVLDASKYDEEKGELGGYGGSAAKVTVSIKMLHEKEVNRARYCPQNAFLIATKSPSADVLVYDYSKHPSTPANHTVRPELRLKGHEREGYGLSWSTFEQGRLLSSGDDKLICMWDTASGVPEGKKEAGAAAATAGASHTTVLSATRKFAAHRDIVEDVQWSRHSPHLFGSCGDDKQLMLWDVRTEGSVPKLKQQAHDGDVMALSFSPFEESLLLTCATDRLIKLWDLRSMKSPLHTFVGHEDQVTGIAWSPFNSTVFASTGCDRRIFLWDSSLIGAEQSEEDAADGPPELLFVHSGHTAKVSDFSWCETDDWFIASVAEDNILQIWQPAETVYAQSDGDDDEEEEGEEEEAAAAGAAAGAGSKPPAKRARNAE